ncbi:MAG TPA: hypothetical protein VFZ25_19315 [Chloroflexota bacterium]|nr:hypothetical protein [Chloroflexota bacterium]
MKKADAQKAVRARSVSRATQPVEESPEAASTREGTPASLSGLSSLVERLTPERRGSAPAVERTILHLQQTLGNQAVQRLIQRKPNPAHSSPPTDASAPIQRKVFVGDEHAPYAGDQSNPKVAAMVRDDPVRRFKNNAEVTDYAEGKVDNVGYLTGARQWVRVDDPFVVLGEDHGADTTVLELVAALKTRRFRYEGFDHYSKTRLKSSQELRDRRTERARERSEEHGLAAVDEKEHEAEHVLPKIARTLPDVQELIRRQGARELVAEEDVTPGAPLPAGYALAKTLLKMFLDALIYSRSYGSKFFKHPIKAFYSQHQPDLDAAISALQAAEKLNTVPDLQSLAFIRSGLPAMIATYERAAMGKLKIKDAPALRAWKAKLNLKKEKKVTLTDKAQELDYLRDYSMFQTVKKSKAAGDLVFGMGDAHREKLTGVLADVGIKDRKLKDLLKEEKAKDEGADKGLNVDDALLAASFDLSSLWRTVTAEPGRTEAFFQNPGRGGVTWDLAEFERVEPAGKSGKDARAFATSPDREKTVTARLVKGRAVLHEVAVKVEAAPAAEPPAEAPAGAPPAADGVPASA